MILGVAIGILSICLFFLWAQISSMREEVYHEYATSKAYADAQESVRNKCIAFPTVEEIKSCFDDAVDSSREPQRSEEDLYTQKQMAVWAKWMFYATLFIGVMSIFIASAGVYLVQRTLRLQSHATRHSARATMAAIKANQLAHDAYIAERRPWLTVKIDMRTDLMISEAAVIGEVKVEIQNIGKTIAERMFLKCQTIPLGDDVPIIERSVKNAQ